MTNARKAASNAEVESAAVSADAIAVLLSENTDIEDSSYVAVQIASLIEAGLAATLDQQVKHMVERFLRWRLPENFNPDCGITFKAIYNEHSPFGPSKAEPVGTNLFDYIQAEAMVRHMLDGLPVQAARAPQAPQGDGVTEAHPDDAAVDRFAAVMATKLAKKRDDGRGGWEDKEQCSNALLSRLLREHVEKGDPVDVANLAMMIHQRGEAIAPAPILQWDAYHIGKRVGSAARAPKEGAPAGGDDGDR